MATAQKIISDCGGPKVVAGWLRLDRSTVQRWIDGGRIPEKRWATLIIAARVHKGVEIALEDLIPAAVKQAANVGQKRKTAA